MDRVLLNAGGTISGTFAVGSTPTDPSPDSATVTITRADGTVLTSNAPASQGAVAGQFTWALIPSTQVNLLDTLTIKWTSSQFGSIYTFVEVVGGFLCPLSTLAALYPSDSDDTLRSRRTALETRLEGALHRACVPRYNREVHVARGGHIYTDWSHVRMLREITIGGVTESSATVANTLFNPLLGKLFYMPLHRLGEATIVAYEHGDDYPTADVQLAMELLAKEMYGSGTIPATDSRVIRREADQQSITYATPSGGGPFLTPELNAIVRASASILQA